MRGVFALLVAAVGVARAANPDGGWAVAVQVPELLEVQNGSSLSVWRVEPGRSWGLELGASLARTSRESEGVELRRDSANLSAAFQVNRSGPARGDVTAFWFQRIGASTGRYEETPGRRNTRYHVRAGGGIGVQWQPFRRVGFWFRQGVFVSYSKTTDNLDTNTGQALSLSGPAVQLFFLI